MKTISQIIKETVDKPKSPDEQRFMDKHVVDKKDYPVANDVAHAEKMKQAKRDADLADGEDEEVYEEMSASQIKKREEIVTSMKKNIDGFKQRYGDKAKEVMYATANKQAMKEDVTLPEIISEARLQGKMELQDGSTVTVSKDDESAFNNLFDQLSGTNKKKMQDKMMADKKGYSEILAFAKESM